MDAWPGEPPAPAAVDAPSTGLHETAVSASVSGVMRKQPSFLRRAIETTAAIATLWAVTPSPAHEAFSEFIWHRVELGRTARYLDVTLELTFFEKWSMEERRRMDADGDGRIQRAELEAHARRIATMAQAGLTAFVGGQRVELIPLYAPDVNLLGRDAVVPAHHRVTLRFFATLPESLPAGVEIRIEDRLWLRAQSMADLAVSGDDAATLALEPVAARAVATPDNAQPLRFNARLLKIVSPTSATQ